MKSIFALCVVVLFLIPPGLHAGDVRLTAPAPIGSTAYQIMAVIEDDHGNLVSGLTAEHFFVSVDRVVTATSEVFPVTDQWMAVALLIDKSGSMKGKPLDAAKSAATDFVQRCSHQTLFAVVPFDDSPVSEPDFKRKEQGVAFCISRIEPGNDTSLYDAVLAIILHLESYWPPVKAMIALTDGKDTKSEVPYEDLLTRLNGSSIPVYTVGLGSGLEEDRLESMAQVTGGCYFHAPAPDDLVEVYRAIASELEQGYVVRFDLPSDLAETGTHVLELTVVSDGDTMIGAQLFDMTGDSHGAEAPHTDSALSAETEPEPQSRKEIQCPLVPVLYGAGIGLAIGAVLLLLVGRGERGTRLLFASLITLLGALAGALYWISVS